jgi:hypothetical protein
MIYQLGGLNDEIPVSGEMSKNENRQKKRIVRLTVHSHARGNPNPKGCLK